MNELNFHKWLRDNREASGLTQQQLADKAGVTKGYVSLLERNQPHTITGALPKPDVEKVDALAKALNASVDEARLAAGYAPTGGGIVSKPRNVEEFFQRLDEMGFKDVSIQFEGGSKAMRELDEDDLQELLDSFVAAAGARAKRKASKK